MNVRKTGTGFKYFGKKFQNTLSQVKNGGFRSWLSSIVIGLLVMFGGLVIVAGPQSLSSLAAGDSKNVSNGVMNASVTKRTWGNYEVTFSTTNNAKATKIVILGPDGKPARTACTDTASCQLPLSKNEAAQGPITAVATINGKDSTITINPLAANQAATKKPAVQTPAKTAAPTNTQQASTPSTTYGPYTGPNGNHCNPGDTPSIDGVSGNVTGCLTAQTFQQYSPTKNVSSNINLGCPPGTLPVGLQCWDGTKFVTNIPGYIGNGSTAAGQTGSGTASPTGNTGINYSGCTPGYTCKGDPWDIGSWAANQTAQSAWDIAKQGASGVTAQDPCKNITDYTAWRDCQTNNSQYYNSPITGNPTTTAGSASDAAKNAAGSQAGQNSTGYADPYKTPSGCMAGWDCEPYQPGYCISHPGQAGCPSATTSTPGTSVGTGCIEGFNCLGDGFGPALPPPGTAYAHSRITDPTPAKCADAQGPISGQNYQDCMEGKPYTAVVVKQDGLIIRDGKIVTRDGKIISSLQEGLDFCSQANADPNSPACQLFLQEAKDRGIVGKKGTIKQANQALKDWAADNAWFESHGFTAGSSAPPGGIPGNPFGSGGSGGGSFGGGGGGGGGGCLGDACGTMSGSESDYIKQMKIN